MKKIDWSQFAAFVGVGALATCFDYGAFFLAFQIFDIPAVPASLLGYAIGGIVSYLLSRSFVFGSERKHREAIWRFMSVMAAGFVLTGAAMFVFVNELGLWPLIARIMTYAIVLIFNYFTHRIFTFSR